MSEYIYIEPNRNKGEGARSREATFVRLSNPIGENGIVRGEAVDHRGHVRVRDFCIQREHCRNVWRAIMGPSGDLVVADNKLGR